MHLLNLLLADLDVLQEHIQRILVIDNLPALPYQILIVICRFNEQTVGILLVLLRV